MHCLLQPNCKRAEGMLYRSRLQSLCDFLWQGYDLYKVQGAALVLIMQIGSAPVQFTAAQQDA
eukprot:469215-Amphidinium_carterae.2